MFSPEVRYLVSCVVSTWTVSAMRIGEYESSSYGMSAGMSASLGLSLLCTTKTANWVRLASRSDSGSLASSRSTSFWSSVRA